MVTNHPCPHLSDGDLQSISSEVVCLHPQQREVSRGGLKLDEYTLPSTELAQPILWEGH